MDKWFPAWLLVVTLLPGGAALAATVISYRSSGDCAASFDRLVAQGAWLRMDSRVDGQAYSGLFDGHESLFTSLMHERREYLQIEVDLDAVDYQGDVMASTGHYIDRQFDKIAELQREQCQQLEKQGMACPQMPDLQAMMAQMGSMTGAATVETVDTGRSGEFGGFACRWWQQRRAGLPERDTCHGDIAQVPFPEADQRGLARGFKAMQRYAGTMTPLMQRFVGGRNAAAEPDRGLILAEVCYAGDGVESGRVVATISQQSVAASEFEIPANYRRMEMQEGASHQR